MNDFSQSSPLPSQKKNSPKMKYFLIGGGIIVIVVVLLLVKTLTSHPTRSVASATSQAAIDKPQATQKLNKSFSFPLKDSTGKVVSNIKMVLTDAELTDQIVVKGEKATAIEGRTFLILNFKLTNTYDKSVQINTRDYVRLSVNKSGEKLAADIHNDPVEVQADSTKYTRLGFPINKSDKDLVLHIGEINGKKQDIPLTF